MDRQDDGGSARDYSPADSNVPFTKQRLHFGVQSKELLLSVWVGPWAPSLLWTDSPPEASHCLLWHAMALSVGVGPWAHCAPVVFYSLGSDAIPHSWGCMRATFHKRGVPREFEFTRMAFHTHAHTNTHTHTDTLARSFARGDSTRMKLHIHKIPRKWSPAEVSRISCSGPTRWHHGALQLPPVAVDEWVCRVRAVVAEEQEEGREE